MKFTFIFVALLLAGCVTRPHVIETKVPVTVGCVGALPERPEVTFGVGAWPGDKAAAQASQIDSLAFQSYSAQLEAVIQGCPKK